MFKDKLNQLIDKKNSLLCVGLDTDLERIPKFLLSENDPLLIFNREIIQATSDYTAAYKINIAFYEALGVAGWRLLEKTLKLLPGHTVLIADAKRADIGNTSRKYAETFFETYQFDAVTVSPYMGTDSLSPFLEFSDRGVFILCLTSNKGSQDFQYLNIDSEPLYLHVARKAALWNLEYGNCGLVAGATHPEDLSSIREIAPNLPLLIPGIGAQGGNLAMAVQFGTDENGRCALINSSRGIIYASDGPGFAEASKTAARELQNRINEMRQLKTKSQLDRG